MANDTFVEKFSGIGRRRLSAHREGRMHSFEQELRDLCSSAETTEEKFYCALEWASHYHFVQQDSLALDSIKEGIALCPERVEAWLGLTEHYHYYDVDQELAAFYVEAALEKAEAENAFVRQVLGVRIRIALERGQFDVVNESLARLIAYRKPPHSVDVAYEDDFVSRIPVGAVDEDVLQRYQESISKKTKT
jgi:hypothetical protein